MKSGGAVVVICGLDLCVELLYPGARAEPLSEGFRVAARPHKVGERFGDQDERAIPGNAGDRQAQPLGTRERIDEPERGAERLQGLPPWLVARRLDVANRRRSDAASQRKLRASHRSALAGRAKHLASPVEQIVWLGRRGLWLVYRT